MSPAVCVVAVTPLAKTPDIVPVVLILPLKAVLPSESIRILSVLLVPVLVPAVLKTSERYSAVLPCSFSYDIDPLSPAPAPDPSYE